MLLSPSSNQLQQASLPFNSSTTSSQGSLAQAGRSSASGNESSSPLGESKETPEGARVTLMAPLEKHGLAPELSPVYAEIWKNGLKVAEIDTHGGVNTVNGLVASAQGTVGSGGTLLAARRAAEIVRSVGGEIRVGGQLMDSQTLEMRAKLKIAYGS